MAISNPTNQREASDNNLKEYTFDRFRGSCKMAEGARVKAHSLEEAIKKARNLFPECPNDTFKERV